MEDMFCCGLPRGFAALDGASCDLISHSDSSYRYSTYAAWLHLFWEEHSEYFLRPANCCLRCCLRPKKLRSRRKINFLRNYLFFLWSSPEGKAFTANRVSRAKKENIQTLSFRINSKVLSTIFARAIIRCFFLRNYHFWKKNYRFSEWKDSNRFLWIQKKVSKKFA